MGSGDASPSGTRSGRTGDLNDQRGAALSGEGAAGGPVADLEAFDDLPALEDDDLPGSMTVEDLSPAIDRDTLRAAKAADDATAFARAVFSDGARAPRVDDADAPARWAYPPAEPGHDDRYGGFPEYDRDDVAEWTPLGEPLTDAGGIRADFMERGAVDSDAYAADSVYVCQYCADAVDPGDPGVDRLTAFDDEEPPLGDDRLAAARWQRHNEMAQYAACDALGVDVPRHTYDAATDRLVAEGAGRGVEMAEVSVADDAWLDRADRQEVVDKLAVMTLLGNGDLHTSNLGVDENGGVHTFDLDRGVNRRESVGEFRRVAQSRAATKFDFDRPITDAEITARATEIATAAVVSGHDDAVEESVAAYDDLFARVDDQVDDLDHATTLAANLRDAAAGADSLGDALDEDDLRAAGLLDGT